MEFQRVTLADLRATVIFESYSGGSNLGSQDELERYILRRDIDGGPARDVFEFCAFTRVKNARSVEDDLLETPTMWNQHGSSNVRPEPGYVYVLRYKRPMDFGTKVVIGTGIAAVLVLGGMALNEIFKTPPAPPLPPTPPVCP